MSDVSTAAPNATLSASIAAIPDAVFGPPDTTDLLDLPVTGSEPAPEGEALQGQPRDEAGRFAPKAGEPDAEAADAGADLQADADTDTPPDADGEGAEPAPAAHTVEVLLPNGDGENGLRNAGKLNLAVPDQETADTLRFHLKRSAKLDTLESEVAQLREDAAFAPFFTAQPVAGFATLAQQQPEAFAEFLNHTVGAYHEHIAALLEAQGYSVQPAKDPEVLQLSAKLAQRSLMDLQSEAQRGYATLQADQQLVAAGTSAITSVAESIGLPAHKSNEEFVEFATRAARLLDQQFPSGSRPTAQELTYALQPLAQRFAALRTDSVTKTATRTGQPGTPAKAPNAPQDPEVMRQKLAKTQEYRRLQPGQSTVPITGKVKLPPRAGIKDLVSAIRG